MSRNINTHLNVYAALRFLSIAYMKSIRIQLNVNLATTYVRLVGMVSSELVPNIHPPWGRLSIEPLASSPLLSSPLGLYCLFLSVRRSEVVAAAAGRAFTVWESSPSSLSVNEGDNVFNAVIFAYSELLLLLPKRGRNT